MKELFDLPTVIGLIMIVGFCLYAFVLSIIKHKPIWDAIMGGDKKLDKPDFIVLVGIGLFIIAFFADVFLSKSPSIEMMYSIDAIIFFGLTGKVAFNYLDKKYSKSEKKEE